MTIEAFLTLFFGAVLGTGGITGLVQIISNRNNRKADVAVKLEQASGDFITRLEGQIERFEEINRELRTVAVDLLEVVDEMMTHVWDVDVEHQERWKRSARDARLHLSRGSVSRKPQ